MRSKIRNRPQHIHEVPRDTAHEQALSRWWHGRLTRLTRHADPASLGGRFTPPAAIDDCFDDAPMSKCATATAGPSSRRTAGRV